MNGAHLHLLVNHIPLFAVAFGTVALIWSMVRKSHEMKWAAVGLFLIAGASVLIASETGESAEDIAEKLPGVTEALIHNHEDAAEWAERWVVMLALMAVAIVVSEKFKKSWAKKIHYATLVVALFANTTLARTAFLGGQVRHTEIRDEAAAPEILPPADGVEGDPVDSD